MVGSLPLRVGFRRVGAVYFYVVVGGFLFHWAGLQSDEARADTPTPTATPTSTAGPFPLYSEPVPVVELNSDGNDYHPSVTSDLLEIYFISNRSGNADIWCATRVSIESPWNPPFAVDDLNSDRTEWWPVVSADGLEIFFGSRRGYEEVQTWNRVYKGLRSYRTNSWGGAEEVEELNPPQTWNNYSFPCFLSQDRKRIYTARRFGDDFDLYVSARAWQGEPFSGPTPLPGNVNTSNSELGAAFSGDENTLIFGRLTDKWDVYGANRNTPGGPYEDLGELTEFNDPTCGTAFGHVSPDLKWVWFSSARPDCPGDHDIYVAWAVTVTPTPTLTPTKIPVVGDCNGNGISDPDEIWGDPSLDCNWNGVLDVCETGGYASPPAPQNIPASAQWLCPGIPATGTTQDTNHAWFVYLPERGGTLHLRLTRLTPWPNVPRACIYDDYPASGGTCVKLIYVGGGSLGGSHAFTSYPVTAGQRYYVEVTANQGYRGPFEIEITGPPCLYSLDCDGDSVPDECQEPSQCGGGVLCYDDGDGSADETVNASAPASFLVKFSVPSSLTGLRRVARVTWYAGSATIENPRMVVRSDLSGGFGTSQACIVEEATSIVPLAFNEVDLSGNAKQFLVGAGDVFFAGLYGTRMSLGADVAVTTQRISTADTHWGDYPCSFAPLPVPTPSVGPGAKIACWDGRNYRLDESGVHFPEEFISVSAMGSIACEYWQHHYPLIWTTHTPSSGTTITTTFDYRCQTVCRQDFRLRGRDWLVRVALSGMCSPELERGCQTNTHDPCHLPTFTATATPSITPTFTTTPTLRPMPEYYDPAPIAELNSESTDYAPYLTSDLLEIFFVTDRAGDFDIWSATRESTDVPWNPPFSVVELNSTDNDSFPVVSADGLEIFFFSVRDIVPGDNTNRVYRSTRVDRFSSWSTPTEALELRPPQMDDYFTMPSHLSEDGLRIYTHRRYGGDYDLYVSTRAAAGSPFSGPTPLAGDVNSTNSEAGAAMSGDELTVIFGRVTGAWNLYGAKRHTLGGPFQILREMTELNDATCGTQVGFVSSDLVWIWFSSNRPGCPAPNDIFVAKMLETATPTITPTATITATETPTATATPTLSTRVNGPLWRFR